MWLKVFYFCLILISSQTQTDWTQEWIRHNNTLSGYSYGFDINKIRNEMEMKMQQIKTEIMQQIRAECNCKKMDDNHNFDSNDYYDDY